MPEIVTRKAAQAAGLRRYFTGKPCPKGHVSERYVSGKTCVECTVLGRLSKEDRAAYWQDYYNRNRDVYLKKRRIPEEARKISDEITSILAERGIIYGTADYYKEYVKEHYKQRKQIYRSRDRNRRAKVKNIDGTHGKKDIENLLVLQKGKCLVCGYKFNNDFHVDHVMPIKLNGSNCAKNLQLLCGTCNRRKGAKHPEVFARERGLLI